ncbi:helix-turn-helix domain-containing protein [Dryocola clanedunensis]
MLERSRQASLCCYASMGDLDKEKLAGLNVVVADLSEDTDNITEVLKTINELQNCSRHIYWLFLLRPALIDIAIERIFSLRTSLMSVSEPAENVIEQIFNGEDRFSYISPALLAEKSQLLHGSKEMCEVHLTFSERSVLRLVSKGWRVNQIAVLLKKSNKTVSAQKKSAMRRLGLGNDAALFSWLVSEEGRGALNLVPTVSETEEPLPAEDSEER